MATYKNELEKIEAQEKQLNAQKQRLAQQKRNLKKKLAEQEAENEAKTVESTKQLNNGLLIIVQSLILNVLLTNEIAMMCMSR